MLPSHQILYRVNIISKCDEVYKLLTPSVVLTVVYSTGNIFSINWHKPLFSLIFLFPIKNLRDTNERKTNLMLL